MQLRKASPDIVCRSPEVVRRELGEDLSLVEDLEQDVALAMLEAIRRQKLGAARPAIHAWIERTTYWIVKGQVRQAAILALTGTVLVVRDDAEGAPVGEANAVAGFDGAPIADDADYERGVEHSRRLRGLLLGSGAGPRLTEAQRSVVVRCAVGYSAEDIADDLEISPVAVRLRLMHARRRLAA